MEEGTFMEKKKIGNIIYIVISLFLFVVIICLARDLFTGKKTASESKGITVTEDNGKKLFDNAKDVKETVTINTEIISDGLREMGILITEEYYFTQVEEYSSTKEIVLFKSESSFTYSYDGVVSAGIDCNNIEISKNEEEKTLTISIPSAYIINVDIDQDSFKIYEEKNGLWNKNDLTKFNDSLIEFEKAAKEKAIEKNIIQKANEGAHKLIESFVNSLIDPKEYSIEYVTK